jgi:AraC-like DNA-binding protein
MFRVTQSDDARLGTWSSARWQPAPGDVLEGIVDRIWHWNGATLLPRERTFPDGRFELIVQLDHRYRPAADKPVDAFPALCAGGMHGGPWVVEAPPSRCRVMGVRLSPPGAAVVFGMPLAPITGTSVALDDVVGRAAADVLATRCSDARSARACIAAAVTWLRERVLKGPSASAAATWMYGAIERSAGTAPIGGLCDLLAPSPARVAAAFATQFGVTPKRFARIVRFSRTLTALPRAPSSPALDELALAFGYYDQAHFNAEFRAHSGLTPTEFLRAMRYPDSVSLAEPSPSSNAQELAPLAG